ncbi:MAG TPA: serine/threonine-protein kinase [Gemmatimonadales bacterium]|nr:serine/threonine-protein kinase [Gemmatimonadales bacterium]
MPEPDTRALLAKALGAKYEVKRLVGSGGFAEVYEVWDKELERRLAVKVLRPDVAWTAGTVERFQRETRAAARLEHPNVLPIHFVGEGEGLAYYAMPFVEGLSLGELLRRSGVLPPDRALAIIIPILDALEHAHKAGLLHRDVKPDNIMLDTTRGRPLLVDFGIARRLDAEAGAGLTQTGLVIGTPHYMSPEQALGDPNLGPGSDIYSLGAVLFQMVTGSPPFEGQSSQEIVGKHIAEPPPAAADVNPNVPRALSDTILRCLAKQPAERFQSAADVIRALEGGGQPTSERARASAAQKATELLVGRSVGRTAGRPDVGRSGGQTAGRPRRIGWVVLAIVLAVLAVGGWATFLRPPQLVFENRLAGIVAVQVAGEERRLLPGGSLTLKVQRARPLALSWRFVRPETGEGAMGVPLGDTVTVVNPRGRVRLAATASPRNNNYFAPLITNETGRPITITVNAGLAGSLPCRCTVPPGAVRMEIGYYPLFANSTVRAEEVGSSRTATFRDLGREVNARGVVGLLFRAADLR